MTTQTTKAIVSATATSVTSAQKTAIQNKQMVTPVELAPALRFPLYAFTVKGRAVKGAELFGKNHHFCHVGLQDVLEMVRKYRLNNNIMARMVNGVGATTAKDGFVFVSYDQKIGLANPLKKTPPYRKPMYDFLHTLEKEVIVVSDNHFVLELADRAGFKTLHRTVTVARKHKLHHVVIARGVNRDATVAFTSLFSGIKTTLVTY